MLEIKPVQEKSEQERICNRCGIRFDADLLLYAAYVDGELVGASQFSVKMPCGEIQDIKNTPESDDADALFIMGRQTVNFIDLCGVHEAILLPTDPSYETLAKRIGFTKGEDGIWRMDLLHFFESPCGHAHP